jgi:hypothetical protein
MKRASKLFAASLACATLLAVNGASAEPPDPCKTGCRAGGFHVMPLLNPQPLPPGNHGGGGGSGKITLFGKTSHQYSRF